MKNIKNLFKKNKSDFEISFVSAFFEQNIRNIKKDNEAININLNKLEFNQSGELIINNYPNLKKIDGYDISNLTKITTSNCPQLEKVYINHSENLQELILNKLPNLKEIHCLENNNLTNLALSDCSNLQIIICFKSNLTQIKLP